MNINEIVRIVSKNCFERNFEFWEPYKDLSKMTIIPHYSQNLEIGIGSVSTKLSSMVETYSVTFVENNNLPIDVFAYKEKGGCHHFMLYKLQVPPFNTDPIAKDKLLIKTFSIYFLEQILTYWKFVINRPILISRGFVVCNMSTINSVKIPTINDAEHLGFADFNKSLLQEPKLSECLEDCILDYKSVITPRQPYFID
ncbi:hypothetical protein SDC9_52670 [bioreactor metagenome]|uniref:Uncharacterized protein n=1 Tax=bioreactor metagenome TaxID=1076179 RepID=A0A644WS79_9ZZZZ